MNTRQLNASLDRKCQIFDEIILKYSVKKVSIYSGLTTTYFTLYIPYRSNRNTKVSLKTLFLDYEGNPPTQQVKERREIIENSLGSALNEKSSNFNIN